jgi:hypothetical protein
MKSSSNFKHGHPLQTTDDHTTQTNPTGINTTTPATTYHQSNLTNLHNTTAHLPFGDIMTNKEQGTIRLYLQNINGAKLENHQEAWSHAIDFVDTNKIDYIGLVETRVDWNYKNKK